MARVLPGGLGCPERMSSEGARARTPTQPAGGDERVSAERRGMGRRGGIEGSGGRDGELPSTCGRSPWSGVRQEVSRESEFFLRFEGG